MAESDKNDHYMDYMYLSFQGSLTKKIMSIFCLEKLEEGKRFHVKIYVAESDKNDNFEFPRQFDEKNHVILLRGEVGRRQMCFCEPTAFFPFCLLYSIRHLESNVK